MMSALKFREIFYVTILVFGFNPVCFIARSDNTTTNISITSIEPGSGTIGVSLRNEIRASIDRSLNWLAVKQNIDGSWSNNQHPALTALALMAIMRTDNNDSQTIISSGLDFIASCVREDGGIYQQVKPEKGGGLKIYNTAVCMMALYESGKKKYKPVIRNARRFISGKQHFGDDIYKGGFGYYPDTGHEYLHGLDTFYSAQAMAITSKINNNNVSSKDESTVDWKTTVEYFVRRQKIPPAPLLQDKTFAYYPGKGINTNRDVHFHSYGSMTYAGLLALVYADVQKNDVRVRSAFDWAQKHWSLNENPGKGKEGLFFFYYVLSRALSVYNVNLIRTADGRFLNWRNEVAVKLVSLQKIDAEGYGYWKNISAGFWETDPVLCTAYALLSLEMILPAGLD